jgi:hypothetical protein
MSGSISVYITQSFHTVNWICLLCSLVIIVSRNRSELAKPRWGLNGLCFSAAISAHWRWVVVFIYDISSPMWCHILSFGYLILYLRLFKARLFFLFFFTSEFLSHFSVSFCSLFILEMIGLRQAFDISYRWWWMLLNLQLWYLPKAHHRRFLALMVDALESPAHIEWGMSSRERKSIFRYPLSWHLKWISCLDYLLERYRCRYNAHKYLLWVWVSTWIFHWS